MDERKKPAAEGGQDLRRLKRTVSILGISVIVLSIGCICLAIRFVRIVQVLDLITENIRLLGLRLNLISQTNDDLTQIISNIFEILSS